MSKDRAVDIVIVSYRCRELLRDCLTSVAAQPAASSLRVNVVDNASEDGTAEMVGREFPDVTLTQARSNLGFAAASNIGIRAGRATYVLALNPDTRVPPGALDRLLDVMDAHPKVGVCGPRLELEDGTFDHAAKRGFPTPLSALAHFTGIGRRIRTGALAAYRAPHIEAGPVDAVNGAFMLMRRAALDQVGLFDEGYWMYMEDLDLCYRLSRAGWIAWYEPSVTVTHVKGGTTGRVRSMRLDYAFHYGMYRFYRKHYSPHRGPVQNIAVYCGIAVKLAFSILRSGALRLLRAPPRPMRASPSSALTDPPESSSPRRHS